MKKLILLLFSICFWNIVKTQNLADSANYYHQAALQEYDDGNDSLAYMYMLRSLSIIENNGDTLTEKYVEYLYEAGLFSIKGGGDFNVYYHYMQKSISLEKMLFGESDDYYWLVQCLGDGMLFFSRSSGSLKDIPMLEKALDTYNQVPFHDTIKNYCTVLNNLAEAYVNVNVEKSIAYIQRKLSIQRKYFPESDTLTTMSNLGKYYKEIGNYQESLTMLLGVLQARENQANPDTNKLIQSNMRLASLYSRMRHNKEAYYYSEKARILEQLQNGNETQLYATISMNSALYLYMSGNVLQGIKMLKDVYLYDNSDEGNIASNLAAIYSGMGIADSCYYYLSKAWDEIQKKVILDIGNLSLEDRFTYLTSEKTYALITLPIHYFLQHKNHRGLKRLAVNCILFYKKLSFEFTNLDSVSNSRVITVDTIKSYLRRNEMAIELWYNIFEDDKSITNNNIIAFIIQSKEEDPIYVELSADSIILALNNKLETSKSFLPLYETMWKKIFDRAKIKRNGTIYIDCDGIYALTPIEYICNYDFEYIGDVYSVVRVSHLGNIPYVNNRCTIKDVALYGGLEYDCSLKKEDIGELAYSTELLDFTNDTLFSNTRDVLQYLFWSKKEIDSINTILHSARDINQIHNFSGRMGTEESFTNLSGKSPSIIHLATHGQFLLANEEMSWFDYYKFCMDNSGLFMSCSSGEKKILSAEKIRHLDLSQTKVLVLSACNTGKGGVSPFGMFGLQNAFKQAGVGSIIMTLNKVNDAATCYFMINFYSAIATGLTPRDAFKVAQKKLRSNEYFEHFNYWAYFVMID